MPGQETPACARNPRSAATSSPQNRHRRPHPVLKVTRSHFVVKNVQQPEDVTVDAARRGDYRWKKGVTHSLCRIARPIFVHLLLCPLRKYRKHEGLELIRMINGSIAIYIGIDNTKQLTTDTIYRIGSLLCILDRIHILGGLRWLGCLAPIL